MKIDSRVSHALWIETATPTSTARRPQVRATRLQRRCSLAALPTRAQTGPSTPALAAASSKLNDVTAGGQLSSPVTSLSIDGHELMGDSLF
jgi:hypothetical protein